MNIKSDDSSVSCLLFVQSLEAFLSRVYALIQNLFSELAAMRHHYKGVPLQQRINMSTNSFQENIRRLVSAKDFLVLNFGLSYKILSSLCSF